jgi:monoterpene epsilon-lactone hydrolase
MANPHTAKADVLPPERVGHCAPEELLAQRSGIGAAIRSGLWQCDPAPVEHWIAGVRCLDFAPVNTPRATILHLHGGGFRLGCPEQVGPFAAALAARCQVRVVCPAYRLAPEHPFPAALGDGRSVMAQLTLDSAPLIVSGDSAGGGLAAGLAALTAQAGGQLAGLVLLSPWLDLTVTSPCYAGNAARDPLFSEASARAAAALYLQGAPSDGPLVSPLFGAVSGFPASYIAVGTDEVLLEDARSMADKLDAGGIGFYLQEVEGMEHVAVVRDRSLTGAAETFAGLTAFIDRILE